MKDLNVAEKKESRTEEPAEVGGMNLAWDGADEMDVFLSIFAG